MRKLFVFTALVAALALVPAVQAGNFRGAVVSGSHGHNYNYSSAGFYGSNFGYGYNTAVFAYPAPVVSLVAPTVTMVQPSVATVAAVAAPAYVPATAACAAVSPAVASYAAPLATPSYAAPLVSSYTVPLVTTPIYNSTFYGTGYPAGAFRGYSLHHGFHHRR
jgi:hypothetical protein